MTKEELAALLNGREYGNEITKEEAAQAKAAGLVVAFGYSDDGAEFRGAAHDERGAWEGATYLVNKYGEVLEAEDRHRCDCDQCGFQAAIEGAVKVEFQWLDDRATDYCWEISASVAYAGFDVMEDGEKFCRGIVFDLPKEP